MPGFMRVEDLQVYQRLCLLHIEVCDLTHRWPSEERFELASQVSRSSNSSPANLAEKHSKARYEECVRILNGLERTLERQLDEKDRLWPGVREESPPASRSEP